jgi:hypothetical protein
MKDIIPTMESWEQHLLRHTHFLVDEIAVWHSLIAKQCYIASDGSAPAPKGSFAWIISLVVNYGLRVITARVTARVISVLTSNSVP